MGPLYLVIAMMLGVWRLRIFFERIETSLGFDFLASILQTKHETLGLRTTPPPLLFSSLSQPKTPTNTVAQFRPPITLPNFEIMR